MGRWPAQGDEKRFSSNYCQWKRRPPPLSSRPERSVVERSAVSAVLPWQCFSTGGVMGLRPAQGDEKYLLFGNYTRWKRRPPLCHLDRSAAEWRDLRCQRSFPGPEKSRRRKKGPVPQRLLLEAPPSPLSSRPERSGVERSALSAVLPWAGEVKAMKNGSCSATTVAGSTALPFVISTGAQRSGEICGVSGPSLGRRSQGDETGPVQQLLLLEAPPSPYLDRRSHGPSSHPRR